MADHRRILELALKGLEAEGERIQQEMADLRRQLGGGAARSAVAIRANGAGRKRRSNLTPAGRRKLSEMMKKRWAERRRAVAKAGK